jgi:hypothetical protein
MEKTPFIWRSMCKRCYTVFDWRKGWHCPNCGRSLPIVGALWFFGVVFFGLAVWKLGDLLGIW